MARQTPGPRVLPSKFFEEYALYRSFACELPVSARQFDEQDLYPPVRMECKKCQTDQTFRVADRFLDGERIRQADAANAKMARENNLTPDGPNFFGPTPPNGHLIVINYKCAACNLFYYKVMFEISLDGKSISKVGQSPPWSIQVESSVKKALGPHIEDYKKGLVCESQGYGIGAFAYYRRIVELIIKELLKDIEELIPNSTEKTKYHEALSNISDSQSAATRIHVVKDLLPLTLRPSNANPLDLLYSALSGGLHSETDQECLGSAEAIRTTLIYLISEVTERKRNAEEYSEKIGSLLEKVKKKGQTKTDVK